MVLIRIGFIPTPGCCSCHARSLIEMMRERGVVIVAMVSSWIRGSLRLQLHVLVGRRECPARDEPESGFRHPGPLCMDEAELPERREDRLLVHELLDAMKGRLAALSIQLDRLLAEEPVDVGIAAVHVGASRHHEVLETAGGVAERAAQAVDEVLQLFLLIPL